MCWVGTATACVCTRKCEVGRQVVAPDCALDAMQVVGNGHGRELCAALTGGRHAVACGWMKASMGGRQPGTNLVP